MDRCLVGWMYRYFLYIDGWLVSQTDEGVAV